MRLVQPSCPAELTLSVLKSRWTLFILHGLFQGEIRYADLHRSTLQVGGAISKKVLTQELRALERNGLVVRRVLPGNLPVVSYSLTEIALKIRPVLEAMVLWGYAFEQERTGSIQKARCVLGTDCIPSESAPELSA